MGEDLPHGFGGEHLNTPRKHCQHAGQAGASERQFRLFARHCGIMRQSSVLQACICVYQQEASTVPDLEATDDGRPRKAKKRT